MLGETIYRTLLQTRLDVRVDLQRACRTAVSENGADDPGSTHRHDRNFLCIINPFAFR